MTQKFWKISAASKKWTNVNEIIDVFIKNRVAAIGWYHIFKRDLKEFDTAHGDRIEFLENLKVEFNNYVDENHPEGRKSNSRFQISKFYFDIQKNDIIFLYGNEPFTIVAIGKIENSYYFDINKSNFIFEKGFDYPYFINVEWFCDLRNDPVDISTIENNKLISRNITIINLSENEQKEEIAHKILQFAKQKRPSINFSKYIEDLEERKYELPIEQDSEENIEKRIVEINTNDVEVLEGKERLIEATILRRDRNREIVVKKKAGSDYRCEVCKLNFREKYGELGDKYIVAHHKNPIALRNGNTPTRLEDLDLVCDNCHRMLHRKTPPYTIDELKEIMK